MSEAKELSAERRAKQRLKDRRLAHTIAAEGLENLIANLFSDHPPYHFSSVTTRNRVIVQLSRLAKQHRDKGGTP